MKFVDAEKVATELVKVFARVGIPREIFTDQGSNFTSQLLAELYRMLHIRPIRTSPYLPQTDGLVEHFNQTLKVMLCKANDSTTNLHVALNRYKAQIEALEDLKWKLVAMPKYLNFILALFSIRVFICGDYQFLSKVYGLLGPSAGCSRGRSATSAVTIQKLEASFSCHGLPVTVVTDNGSAFTSQEFEYFLQSNDVKHATTSPYHPASNRLVEWAVQTMKLALKKTADKRKSVESRMLQFLFQYRITPHTTTGVSPAELLMGLQLCSHLSLHPGVEKRVKATQEKQSKYHNRGAKERTFKISAKVAPIVTEEAQTIVIPDNSTWSDLLPAVGPDLQPAAVTEPQPPALLVPAEGPELRQSGWTRRPPGSPTSQLWTTSIAKLLGIELHHTTAYHPQSNGLVKRFHRHLKAALWAQLTGPVWTAALPWVLMGIRTAPKDDLGCSSAELVYGAPLTVPGNYFVSHNSQPEHRSQLQQLRDQVRMQQSQFVFVRRDAHRTPFQRPYEGPFKVMQAGEKTFTIDRGGRKEVISVGESSSAEEGLPIDKVIKTAFCNVLGSEVEHISVLIQIEEQWGERKVFVDLQGRDIPDRSTLQVIPVHKVRGPYSGFYKTTAAVGADAWRRTGVLTFDGNTKLKSKVTYKAIQGHLEAVYGRKFAYGTVVQLCVPRNKRRTSAKQYRSLAKVTTRRCRNGFTLRFNPDVHWIAALYKSLNQLQYENGENVLNINRDDATGFRLDTLTTCKQYANPALVGKSVLTT
ncbi:hypothetical protein EMCRGX_G034513 [Ephydatia muelleri]